LEQNNTTMNDKTQHIIVGSLAGIATLPLAFLAGFANALAAIFLIATVVFFGKEWYDKIKPQPTGFDKMDLVADYIGLFIGYIVAFIIYSLIKFV